MANGDDQGGGFQGLLGNPLFNVGIGLLSASGPSTTPLSFGQRLAQGLHTGNQFQQGFMKTQAAREKLAARAQRRDALQQLGDMFQPGTRVDASQLPTGEDIISGLDASPGRLLFEGGGVQAGANVGDLSGAVQQIPMQGLQEAGGLQSPQVMGLLSEAAPEQFTQGLLNQVFPSERSDTSLVRNLRAAGIDPRSPEGQEIIRRNLSGNDISGDLAQLEVLQTRNEIMRQQQALAKARREAQESQESSRKKRANLRRDVLQQISLGTEAAELLTDLEGTFGETGVGAGARNTLSGAVGAAQSIFGERDSRAQEIASKAQRLNQIATDFGFENFNAFNAAISDQKAQIALGKDLSLDKTPQANRLALADRLEVALDQAQTEGIEVGNAPKVRKLIQRLRSGGQQGGGQPRQFSSEQEANAALERGQIQVGDEVIVNGRRFRVEE